MQVKEQELMSVIWECTWCLTEFQLETPILQNDMGGEFVEFKCVNCPSEIYVELEEN